MKITALVENQSHCDLKHVLFTAFTGTSSEQFLRQTGQEGIFLPSNKTMDAKMLTEEISAKKISAEKYDYVFSFGQKPNIKDKVYIERTARNAGECLRTTLDCEGLPGHCGNSRCK